MGCELLDGWKREDKILRHAERRLLRVRIRRRTERTDDTIPEERCTQTKGRDQC